MFFKEPIQFPAKAQNTDHGYPRDRKTSNHHFCGCIFENVIYIRKRIYLYGIEKENRKGSKSYKASTFQHRISIWNDIHTACTFCFVLILSRGMIKPVAIIYTIYVLLVWQLGIGNNILYVISYDWTVNLFLWLVVMCKIMILLDLRA